MELSEFEEAIIQTWNRLASRFTKTALRRPSGTEMKWKSKL